MAPRWGDDLNMKFIELYKEQRCLWDQQDEMYKNKNARERALESIAASLNIDGFGVTEVKAKIKAFRGTFNIEYAKLKNSAMCGSGATDVYVPTLKWFNAMKEVMGRSEERDTRSTSTPSSSIAPKDQPTVKLDPGEIIENETADVENDSCEVESYQECQVYVRESTAEKRSRSPAVNSQPPKKTKKFSKRQKIVVMDQEPKNHCESVNRYNDENEWDIYGRHVAAQLKLLSAVQAVTAQMEINNILTKCRFHDLLGTDHSSNLD